MRKWAIAAFLVLLVIACKTTTQHQPIKNVLLITIDTLRADHLGCYGYSRAQTPNLDQLSQNGAIFWNATSVTPLTLPAHSSIMTGAYPLAHGVRDNGGYYLDNKWQTLAETMKASGFHTGGFISAFVLDRRWGIAQGFDEYFDHFELSKYKAVSMDAVQRRGDETLGKALAWLDKNKSSRFFTWIHFYDPHTPYDPPEPFRSQFQDKSWGLYDGEIAFVDNLVGRIRDYLTANNLLNTTLVVITGDHGESLGEHQEGGHGFFIYDATTHVPLIILDPGEKPAKVADQVRSIDLFPTICEAVGVKIPSSVQGVSLLPLVRGGTLSQKLIAYSESYFARFHYGWSELKSLRTPEYKYIDAPDKELYRLSQDRSEKDNLYATETSHAKPFEVEITRLVSISAAVETPKFVDEDSLNKLQALGYIGTYTAPLQSLSSGPLPDPKGKIRLYNLVKNAQGAAAEDKTDEAFKQIRQVLQEDPRILEAHITLGNLYSKQKDYGRARESFQNALNLNDKYAAGIFGLAKSYEDEGNLDAAETGFRRLTELDPHDSKAYFHLGEIALHRKQYDVAVSNFKRAVDLDPDQAGSRNRLGACYLEMKDYDKALAEFQKALELNPRIPNSHFNTALIDEAHGKVDQAIQEYKKEAELFPETYAAYFNLSRIYRARGDLAEERNQLEQCIKQKADFGIAYLYLAKNLMDTTGDLDKVIEVATKGLEMTKDTEQLAFGHYLLADVYNRLGMAGKANTEVQLAKKLQTK